MLSCKPNFLSFLWREDLVKVAAKQDVECYIELKIPQLKHFCQIRKGKTQYNSYAKAIYKISKQLPQWNLRKCIARQIAIQPNSMNENKCHGIWELEMLSSTSKCVLLTVEKTYIPGRYMGWSNFLSFCQLETTEVKWLYFILIISKQIMSQVYWNVLTFFGPKFDFI